MRPPASANPSPKQPPTKLAGANGAHGGYGNGVVVPVVADKHQKAHSGNDDSLRLDMHQARHSSGARRQPTKQIEAEYDPERQGIADVDPAGGAFESTWSMSGRTPPPSSGTPSPQPQSVAQPALTKRSEGIGASRPVQVVRPATGPAPAAAKGSPLNKHVCPFCGMKRDDPTALCVGCGLPDNEGTRGATVARVGPWFVLQPRNPSAPGMRFSVLRELVRSGQVAAGSVVRGPATQQLWTYAARVRGLAHLFGVCWSCNRRLPSARAGEEADDFCVYCGAMQTAPTNPDQQLEALGTSETIGTGVSNLAGQVASALRGEGQIQYRETAPAALPHVRRQLPRPLPPAPRDGGDALLTTRELATAFNLDRKRGLLTTASRVPWVRILITLIVLAGATFGLWLAAKVLLEPLTGLKMP